ncbi:hypothetical protein AB0467_04375 [Streptomyces sp. NPDC052095]|uniref:hypothetical protein n=1 Tax=unclassified Streptomyces TaxID=2593676 RepID=UPI00344C42D1
MTDRPEITLRALLETAGVPAADAVALIDAHARQTTTELREAIQAVADLLYLPFAADDWGKDLRADLALARTDAARPLLKTLTTARPYPATAVTADAKHALAEMPARYRVLGAPENY